MTDASNKPRRRWFQFSLRTLLIAVTLAAGLLVAWRVYVEPYRSIETDDAGLGHPQESAAVDSCT